MKKLARITALLSACALLLNIQGASIVAADPVITLTVQLSTPTEVGLDGAAVLASQQVDLEDDTHLLEPDGSHAAVANSGAGPVNLGAYAHSGGITSTGPVTFIRDGAHVHGDVVTTQAFSHQNTWYVDGDVYEGVTVAVQSELYLQATFASAATPGIHLEPGVILGTPVQPGHYTELILKRDAQATLVAGDYLFGTVAVEPGGQITVDDSAGPVRVYVTDNFDLKGPVKAGGGHPEWIVAYLGAGSAYATAAFHGTLLAPNGSINLESLNGSGQHEGTFYGKRVRLGPHTTLIHRPPPAVLIRTITLDENPVCEGASYHVNVDAFDSAAPAIPPKVFINRVETTSLWGQFEGYPGERRINVTVEGSNGRIETKTVLLELISCDSQTASTPAILRGDGDWYAQDAVNLSIKNVVDFDGAVPPTYFWEFGDGTTATTTVPYISHNYSAAMTLDRQVELFDVSVTVSRPGFADSTGRKTFSVQNMYAVAKVRGSIESPVQLLTPALTIDGPDLVGLAQISNRELEGVSFFERQIRFIPCDVSRIPSPPLVSAIHEEIPSNGLGLFEARFPAALMQADECAVDILLIGTTSSGQKVEARFQLERPAGVAEAAPVDAFTKQLLNYVVSHGLVSDANLITEQQLVELYNSRLLPLSEIEPPAQPQLSLLAAPGELCDPNNPGTPPEPGFSCQPTGEWQSDLADWQDPALGAFAPQAHIANALKGDMVLVRGCSPPLLTLMQTLEQDYTHMGMMTSNLFELRHSTGDTKWLQSEHSDGIAGEPTDGFDEDGLRFLWPGTITATVSEAFNGGKQVTAPPGKLYKVRGFKRTEQRCIGDQKIVYQMVVKPPPEYEEAVRPLLNAAAEGSKQLHGHYRFSSYSQAIDLPEPDPSGPDPVLGADGQPETYGPVPTVCSSFGRFAAQLAGVPLDADKFSPSETPRAEVPTPDGLFFYDEPTRQAAGQALYDDLYNQVVRELEAVEASADDYWWAAGGSVGGVGAALGGPIVGAAAALGAIVVEGELGTLAKWATDAPDDVANQITNCFASDFCSTEAKDSDRWKSPGSGVAVSPDDILNYFDRPSFDLAGAVSSGLYGYRERMIYRGARFRPVARWLPSEGTRTVSGVVTRAESGLPVAVDGAYVYVVGNPAKSATTAADGTFEIVAIPDGNLQFHAQKLLDGVLYEADACYRPDVNQPEFLRHVDCSNFDAPLDSELYQTVTLSLDGPDPAFRKVVVEGSVSLEDCDCCGYDTCSSFGSKSFFGVCQVSPQQPTDSFGADPADLCEDEIGVRIQVNCTLDPATRVVTVSGEARLYEAGSGSCGGGEEEHVRSFSAQSQPEATTPIVVEELFNEGVCIAPFPPVPFDCDDTAQISTMTATNSIAD